MDIGATLSRAWQIIWRNKILWLFGILAGCTSAGNGTLNSGSSYRTEAGGTFDDWLNRLNINVSQEALIVIGIIALIVFLVLLVLFIFLGTIGRIGLIRGTLEAESGLERLTFGELFNGSLPYFWRVFGLAALLIVLTLVVAVIVAISVVTITAVTLGLGLICLLPLLCLLVPLGWIITIIIEQANIAIVVDNVGIMEGLQRGWQVVRANLGTYIVMGLILVLGVGLVGGLIIGLPMFLLVIPAGIGLASQADAGSVTGIAITALCAVAYLPVLLVLAGILTSFTESAWTLTYLRLTGRRPAAVEPAAVA